MSTPSFFMSLASYLVSVYIWIHPPRSFVVGKNRTVILSLLELLEAIIAKSELES